MPPILIEQAAAAMGLNQDAMAGLLSRCGLRPTGGILSPSDVAVLRRFLEEQQSQSRLLAESWLARAAGRYTMLLDTCSLLHPSFSSLMEHLVPLLEKDGKDIIIPSGVIAELKNLRAAKPELASQIHTLLKELVRLRQKGLVKIYGVPGADFADQQILTAAVRAMTSRELLVITQDNGLSEDLLHLNKLNSVQGKRVMAARINRYGFLSRYRSAARRESSQQSGVLPAAELITGGQKLLPVSSIPGAGDEVRSESGALRLGELLSKGGEGVIYELGDGTVAKIYRQDHMTAARRDKLALMVSHPIRCQRVCWPQELLYNPSGDFVGYRMARARGKELQRCLFTRQALEENFPDWEKRDTVRLCVSILETLTALHRQGILLGDINPLNILAVSPEEVWFVDCDSYQIGGYPCPVGTPRFTAPEIQGRDFQTFLRTEGNESFSIATLLFMIMLPGKAPYAHQGSGDISGAIQRMEFPYPCGGRFSTHTPDGSWRFLWSHLPRYLKEYFYHTFQNGGRYSTERNRLTAEQWLRAFQSYFLLLDSGKLQAQDPESGKIFPTRWKIVDQAGQAVFEQRRCVLCGEAFDITLNERSLFLQRGHLLPTRCPACRRLRRLEQAGLNGIA